MPTFEARHQKILHEAMLLVAERGVKGASLRELARRVGISQPSLYHYFDTKHALITQVIEHGIQSLLPQPDSVPPVQTIEELVGLACNVVLALYNSDDYVAFVRFLFAISLESSDWTDLVRERFVEGSQEPLVQVARLLIQRKELAAEDVTYVSNLILAPMVLRMLNRRVLLRESMLMEEWTSEIQFLVETLSAGLSARSARIREESARDPR